MFEIGDLVIHLYHGAGRITDIEKLQCLGSGKQYYAVGLFDTAKTRIWVSVQDAETGQLRQPVTQSRLDQMWCVLQGVPESLPTDHTERYAAIEDKLHTGNVLRIAEVLRDLSWKDRHVRGLTSESRRLYDHSMDLLASEVAIVEESEVMTAKAKITEIINLTVEANALSAG